MKRGTATPPKKVRVTPKAVRRLLTVSLRERTGPPVFTSPLKVDREAGVIYRVKILGWESKNGRRYVPEAVKRSLHRYDGAKAFCDHPDKATDPRACADALGVWRKPTLEPDGAYADLHYFRSHPLAERVCEDAERGLGVFGASHNADGQGEEGPDGVFVVQEITEVRSVDLVTDAATVTNLWESRRMQPAKTTLRALIEASKATTQTKTAWLSLLEDEFSDMPLDAPAEPAPVEGDWKADLVAAIGKLVSSEDETDHKLAQKIMGMLKPGAVAPAETATTENEEEGDEEKEDDEEKPMESRKAKPAADSVTLAEAKSLCKLAGLTEDAALLGMLEGSTRAKALSLLEWAKGKGAQTSTKAVRSHGPGAGLSAADSKPAKFPSNREERKQLLAAH